ncbi:MAG: hypothetical protein ABFR47_04570 [Verrucomicrobiota bacterium]
MRFAFLVHMGVVLLLCGCATTEPPKVEAKKDEAALRSDELLQPENLLFPEYLLMSGFELGQHGLIPRTKLVGAELKTELDLKTALKLFSDLLDSKGWTITSSEVAQRSFRLLAAMKGDALEIRAVQGTGPTQVFILYRPKAVPAL